VILTDRSAGNDAVLPSVVVLGEILWDILGDTRRLGGAPLNFSAHAHALGHRVDLISALGADELGREAFRCLARLGLDAGYVKTSTQFGTGTASVSVPTGTDPQFTIARPAAYDDFRLTDSELESLSELAPSWFYFGTLFAATHSGRLVLGQLLESLVGAAKLLDLNLRPGADAPGLALELMALADVVKLNEDELERVHRATGLPSDAEAFCRAAVDSYGWRAVCVTRGERGCAMLADGDFVQVPGRAIVVADTVGAGDAFTAAFMHGLSRQWPVAEIAEFANGVAATVAEHPSSLPIGSV